MLIQKIKKMKRTLVIFLMTLIIPLKGQSTEELISSNKGIRILMESVDSSFIDQNRNEIVHQIHMDWPTMQYTSIYLSYEENFSCTYVQGHKAYKRFIKDAIKAGYIEKWDKEFDSEVEDYCECWNDRFTYFSWSLKDGYTFGSLSFKIETDVIPRGCY